jgi:GT2 family glycosyltransferase/2-polyprenyl-3-methyl-5-hydroxy-6-metoxy-1,4-benzoquinol methylase
MAEHLTVIIPTRERWPILERTLAALRGQTALPAQTIVVVDGLDQRVPDALQGLTGVRYVVRERGGPGAARNLGVRLASTDLLLFLGDDMVPEPELVARHLERHATEPAREVAVLGHVGWHPEVARRRVNRWLDWSGTQFDYRQLARETDSTHPAPGHPEAGFGRFYSSNISLTRDLFLAVGGFDTAFEFDYEDLDFGWRAGQAGMRLLYEPDAVALHLHAHDLDSIRRRFEGRGAAERRFATKHGWFTPWYHERVTRHAAAPPVSGLWPAVVDLVPENLERVRSPVQARADRWYHQQLAPGFLEGWDGERDLEELRDYLGPDFDHDALVHHTARVDEEAAAVGDEGSFYRTSEQYLYDLTAFAMSGVKAPYRRLLASLVAPGARLLDYGCGIGSDGLRLLERGYRVEFADYANPSTRFLRWRLVERGLSAPVHDLDATVPGGFDLAYAFDVLEHVDDPFALLAELEARAAVVLVNLLAPVADDTPLHRPLPIGAIVRHATRRGLLRHRLLHGRSHVIAYRGDLAPPPARRALDQVRSRAERRLGPRRAA